jgi:predicted nucleic acid-binding protein
MIAVDTNVLVYRLDRTEPEKQAVAKQLLSRLASEGETVLLWQVAGEFVNQLTAWQHQKLLKQPSIQRVIYQLRDLFPLVMPSPKCLDTALDLRTRFSLSHWDSMLLSACIEANITQLYTEDMGATRTIDSIELINPF